MQMCFGVQEGKACIEITEHLDMTRLEEEELLELNQPTGYMASLGIVPPSVKMIYVRILELQHFNMSVDESFFSK